jgi:RNA polymerase sigma-70 factor (ECF subfamily)
MTAEDTLTRLHKLDIAALADMHDRYYPDVYRYVRYRVGDEDLTEDLTSEVFMRLLNALHKRSGPKKNLRSWLIGTASNLVNDHFRKRYRHKIESIEDEDAFTAPDNPETAFDDQMENQQLKLAIQQLTPEQQDVLALRFSQELSLEKTAAQMQKSVNAVKALQFRAISALKRMLDATRQ